MAQTYTKNEIKNLVYSNDVNSSNLADIINSLLTYEFDEEVRDIIYELSKNESVPKSIRTNLTKVIENYDEIVEAKIEEIEHQAEMIEQAQREAEQAEQVAQVAAEAEKAARAAEEAEKAEQAVQVAAEKEKAEQAAKAAEEAEILAQEAQAEEVVQVEEDASLKREITNEILEEDMVDALQQHEVVDKPNVELNENETSMQSSNSNSEPIIDALKENLDPTKAVVVEGEEAKNAPGIIPVPVQISNGVVGDGSEGNNGESAPVSETVEIKPNENVVQPDVVVVEQPGEEEVETINFDSPRRPLRQLRTINYANDDVLSLENDEVLGALTAYATFQGLKVVGSNPGVTGVPQISFELDEVSKPYIDNLLLELYKDDKDNLDVNLTRVAATKKELLTITLDDLNMSQEAIKQQGKAMFQRINDIMHKTKENVDYEEKMPLALRSLKDKFHNDDPSIPNEDFKVGYSRSNGENSYYIVANSKEQAVELAELMGYDIKEDRGGNVFEVDTNGLSMEGSKLDVASENVNELDEMKTAEHGVSDVDVNYNNKHFEDANYQAIDDFIDNSRDPSTMAVIQVDVPSATPNQRVVSLASEDGTRRTVIFNNGDDFDKYTLPKIADKYAEGTTISGDNTQTVKFENGRCGYEALSSDNTYLRLNNYDSGTVNEVNRSLEAYNAKVIPISAAKKENERQKTIGTYPTRPTTAQAANTSFVALLVFVVVLVVGFGVIYLLFGG